MASIIHVIAKTPARMCDRKYVTPIIDGINNPCDFSKPSQNVRDHKYVTPTRDSQNPARMCATATSNMLPLFYKYSRSNNVWSQILKYDVLAKIFDQYVTNRVSKLGRQCQLGLLAWFCSWVRWAQYLTVKMCILVDTMYLHIIYCFMNVWGRDNGWMALDGIGWRITLSYLR